MLQPAPPRLFLIDGYALIYRAFYALLTRPLRTSKGENTSAVWGVANFLQRLQKSHKPEYLGWVHDSGLSFRHELYTDYKATREKLTEELQADFDRGRERIEQLLAAYHIPVIALEGYEADDVIGTLARQAVEQKVNVVIVSGDKDFQQCVRDGVWLLNPGRGGPAAVEEHWVSVDNASERLGVPPERVTDYLALIGDSSDNVPGVPGIGGKTALELIQQYGDIEQIIAHAPEITKKRPREALLANADKARLSKKLVTIHDELPMQLDLDSLRVGEPDMERLRELYVELEFAGMALEISGKAKARQDTTEAPAGAAAAKVRTAYTTVDTPELLAKVVARVREVGAIAINTQTVPARAGAPLTDPLQSRLVGISIAVAPGEAYYLPFAHRDFAPTQGELDGFGGEPRPAEPVLSQEPNGNTSIGAGVTTAAKPARRPSAAALAAQGIAARMLAAQKCEVRNLPSIVSKELAELRALLESEAVAKVAQDVKFDILVFRRAGVALRGVSMDTMLASYVLDPGRRSHGLDLLALEFIGHRPTSYDELCGKGREALAFDVCPIPAARDYSCEDADMALRLAQAFTLMLDQHGLMKLMREIELPLVPVLSEMEWTGIAIDLEWFRSLKERFVREREAITRAIYETAGEEFNINSPTQLREILFVKLGLPVLKRTQTGPSTDASVLQQFADGGEKLPSLILEYREVAKLENTYLDALPALVNPETGRLHTSYDQAVASTGRLSSSNPNLQNIPIRRELGKAIRQGFIPRKGWKMLAVDYSQIELRLLAHMSGDEEFVSAFRAGGDIHRQTASIIFGVPVDVVSSEMRARAKTINFATIYGQGPHALSQQLGIEHAEAKAFIATYFEKFSGVRAYLDSRQEMARELGYVETIFGRRRYIPEIRERNHNIRAFGERLAQNSPIQGSAADLIKIAMIRINAEIRRRGLEARMLLQVHDELVFEVPPGELEVAQEIVRREMEGAAELSVPLVVDMGVGDNWLESKDGG